MLDYECIVGLYLNIDYAGSRYANVIGEGVENAIGGRDVRSFEAMFESQEQAHRAYNRYRVMRELSAGKET